MKRILLYIAAAAIAAAVPVNRADVGKLRPVQAISLYQEDGRCILETDTGDRGVGEDAMEALENLKQTAPAIIYLDTAQFLLLGAEMDEELEALRGKLKSGLMLCRQKEKISPAQAAKYLQVHPDMPRLKMWKKGDKLPELEHFEERLKLMKNYEKKG